LYVTSHQSFLSELPWEDSASDTLRSQRPFDRSA